MKRSGEQNCIRNQERASERNEWRHEEGEQQHHQSRPRIHHHKHIDDICFCFGISNNKHGEEMMMTAKNFLMRLLPDKNTVSQLAQRRAV